jgi:peptide/nickel transport system ATP-binding protein
MADRAPRPDLGYLRDDAALKVRDLTVTFRRGARSFNAVAGVSLDLRKGETLGLVGESGSGKTTIGRAILRLVPAHGTEITGAISYDGVDLGRLPDGEMRAVRRRMQMIFQDPVSSFNPRRKVVDIVGEGLEIQGVGRAERARRIDQALADVGMSREMIGARRPWQFSGGQCQRLAIARALALGPDMIVCDEPVASLDVSVQAHVINLLQDIRAARQLALIFISHDLAVVRNVSDRVAVLYMGRMVEIGQADDIYRAPAHPYTRKLLDAIPVPDPTRRIAAGKGVTDASSQLAPPSGCRFRLRCPRADALCAEVEPQLRPMPQGQYAACHHPLDAADAVAAVPFPANSQKAG